MKILYRPHRGGIIEAMKLLKEFDNINQMLEHIVESYNSFGVDKIQKEDISFHLYHDDEDYRIGWNRGYIIMVKGYPFGFFTDEYKDSHKQIFDEFLNHNK